MKKWMYVIFPGVMLGLFLIVYSAHVKEAEAREKARIEKAAQMRADEEAKKKEAERIAQIDAQKRQKEREEEDRQKEEERRAKQAAVDKKLNDDIAEYQGKADASAKEVADLQIKLDHLRKEKDQVQREDFQLAKEVELARVAKHNAEMQQQHLTQMLAQRANNTLMAQMPPAPPAK